MSKNYYLLSTGRLKREKNTLYFIGKEKETNKIVKKPLPIKEIEAIFIFGEIGLNTKLLNFLAQNKIPIHFFNYYGFYIGSFVPKDYLPSGFLLIKQAQCYIEKDKRLEIAKEFVLGACHNTIKNLIHYKKQEKKVKEAIENIKKEMEKIPKCEKRAELMAIEGRIKHLYYQSFSEILGIEFKKRVRQPPDNMINCLISFGNSLLYTEVLSQIYHTQLNPTISYLHEPGERRYSLALDIAEIFKPVIVDKIIFKLINNKMIKEKHFLKELKFTYLNERGRRLFLENFDKRLSMTIFYKKLKRHISYKGLIRLECYKLIRHLIGEQKYQSFKMWW